MECHAYAGLNYRRRKEASDDLVSYPCWAFRDGIDATPAAFDLGNYFISSPYRRFIEGAFPLDFLKNQVCNEVVLQKCWSPIGDLML